MRRSPRSGQALDAATAAERRRDKLTSPPAATPDPRRLESDGVAPSCSRGVVAVDLDDVDVELPQGFGRDLNAAGRGGGIHRLSQSRGAVAVARLARSSLSTLLGVAQDATGDVDQRLDLAR